MEKNKKSPLKKWWVWVIIVLVIGAVGSSISQANAKVAEMTYEVQGHNAGEPTGNVVELDNGNFTTADIPAGTYDVSNIGWADLVSTTSPLKMVTGASTGTYSGLEIEETTTVEILNQNNSITGSDNSPIIFTEVYTDTVKTHEVTEKVQILNEEETCYVDNLKADCSELENYETLKAEAEGVE